MQTQPRPRTETAEAKPNELRKRLVCVRLCDGEQLVLGFKGVSSSGEESAAMCDAAGAGEETALFSSELGGSTVQLERQGGRATDRSYASIADFLAGTHKDGSIGQCTKQVAHTPMSVPIHADSTLQEGDVVATSKGFVVFVGETGSRHQASNFVGIEKARGISRDLRTQVRKLASQ